MCLLRFACGLSEGDELMRKDWILTCAIAAFALQTPVFGEVIVELRAIEVNDVALGAGEATSLSVSPGDKVLAELILLPGWGSEFPDGIRAAQIVIGGRSGVTSGGNDRVLPLGWDSPLDLFPCDVQEDCAIGSFCNDGQCNGGGHFPELGAFIENRSDYLLFGQDVLRVEAKTTLDYVLGGLDQVAQGQTDTGIEKYLGTYILVVGDFACGTFTFGGITTGIGAVSEVFGPDLQTSVIPTVVPLELNTGTCGPLPSDTPGSLNCSLDARYPHPTNSTTPVFAENFFKLAFDINPAGLSAGDFAVFTAPPIFFNRPTISNLQIVGNDVTITMSRQFDDDLWTCIRHLDTNTSFCRGNLPGDSDQNEIVEFDDVTRMLLDLDPPLLGDDGQPYRPLPLVACDIDRSGQCTPLDLMASMNLFSGSGAFAPGVEGLNMSLTCPSTPAP